MIMIDNKKQIVAVNGDMLELASELSYLHHTLYKEGFGTTEFSSIVCTLMFLTFNESERLEFMKKLDNLVEYQLKKK